MNKADYPTEADMENQDCFGCPHGPYYAGSTVHTCINTHICTFIHTARTCIHIYTCMHA